MGFRFGIGESGRRGVWEVGVCVGGVRRRQRRCRGVIKGAMIELGCFGSAVYGVVGVREKGGIVLGILAQHICEQGGIKR